MPADVRKPVAAALVLAAAVPLGWSGGVKAAPQQDAAANISLSSFRISPSALHLKAGQRLVLRIANDSSVGHDLFAPQFFAAAALGSKTALPAGGKVSLGPHESAVVTLVPKAGRYSMKCSHALHQMLGMSGSIMVDP
jgi:uncharacterized cupredoxin-like copper-binding protein